jgi:C-terminal processing protease CtpA/Prc
VKLIRGPAGSIVQIQIERKGLTKDIPDIKNIPVTRQKLQIPTVISEILTGNIAYIQMSIFGEHTTTEFATEIDNVLVSSPK